MTCASIGFLSRLAGINCHFLTASIAALSSLSKPLLLSTSTEAEAPSALTNTRSITRPSSPRRRDAGGYFGGGLCKYAAPKRGGSTTGCGSTTFSTVELVGREGSV